MTRQIGWVLGLCTLCFGLACGSGDANGSTPSQGAKEDGGAGSSSAGEKASSTIASGPDGAAAKGCEDLSCAKPATCRQQGGEPRCVCPEGYRDVAGDGSKCEDIDECTRGDADGNSACGKHASCKNTEGSFECHCRGPAYADSADKDKGCKCADGFAERDGDCVGPDGAACEDNLDCANDHCVSGVCCAQACSAPPDDCHTDEGATCDDGRTCKYKASKDGSSCEDGDACTQGSVCKAGKCQRGADQRSCDDNNPCTDDSCDSKLGCKNENNTQACDDHNQCTANDQCQGGMCVGKTSRDCASAGDVCNEGVCDPADGSCKKRPRKDGVSCDDANSCTGADQCTAGACKGADNACGKNATSCTPGTPNTCACATSYHATAGVCVPDNDECATNPCGANADCLDPSNNTGDVTCSCKTGFAGDAKKGCSAVDPCQNNPCGEGRGKCAAAADGKHSCTCDAGFREVAGQCVCDMQGTFALRTAVQVSWKNMSGIEDGSGSTLQWNIARQNYDANGSLKLELIRCGETNLDLCGTGVRIAGIAPEAYAQYVPIAVWGSAQTASTLVDFSLPAPIPGSVFKTPRYAVLQGINLTDPLGEWPAKRQDVQGGNDFDGSAVNGARWLDTDADSLFGLTTYAVAPGGVAAGGTLGPIEAYGATSSVCPRSNASAARLAYNYPPALDGLTPRRVKQFSSANRAVSELDGTIRSCNDITGTIGGPDNGHIHYDIRIGNCVRSDDLACSASMLDFLDGNQAPNAIDSHTFIMKRVQDNITCEQVRALSF